MGLQTVEKCGPIKLLLQRKIGVPYLKCFCHRHSPRATHANATCAHVGAHVCAYTHTHTHTHTNLIHSREQKNQNSGVTLYRVSFGMHGVHCPVAKSCLSPPDRPLLPLLPLPRPLSLVLAIFLLHFSPLPQRVMLV